MKQENNVNLWTISRVAIPSPVVGTYSEIYILHSAHSKECLFLVLFRPVNDVFEMKHASKDLAVVAAIIVDVAIVP